MTVDDWRNGRPTHLIQIADPETFFTRVGEQTAVDIDQLTTDLAGQDPPGEDYLTKLGRLRMARFTAEAQILRETVLLPPEDDLDEDETSHGLQAPWESVTLQPSDA